MMSAKVLILFACENENQRTTRKENYFIEFSRSVGRNPLNPRLYIKNF